MISIYFTYVFLRFIHKLTILSLVFKLIMVEETNDITEKIICDAILKAFENEWQRTRDIETKATNVVGFTGIILSLTVASLISLISSTNEVYKEKLFSSEYNCILIYLILIFMTLSIIYGIRVVTVKNWHTLLVNPFLEYCNREKRASEEIYRITTEQYKNIINQNSDINMKIANLLQWSHYFFLGSIIILLVYTIYIIKTI